MSHQEEVDRLLQTEWREKIIPRIGSGNWIQVYKRATANSHVRETLFSGFIPIAEHDLVLQSSSWYMNDEGFISLYTFTEFSHAKKRTSFDPDEIWSNCNELKPLVLIRNWHGLRPKKLEIHQDFRLFHNLWFDEETSSYCKYNRSGDPYDVIRLTRESVSVRRKEIMQYLVEENFSLGLFFERLYFSPLQIDRIARNNRCCVKKGVDSTCKFSASKYDSVSDHNVRSISKVIGRKLVKGTAPEEMESWLEDKSAPQHYQEFIVGADEDGEDVFFTCDPSLVNPISPKEHTAHHSYFLRSVYFRKRVLDKYIQEPNKYKVEPTSVRCGDLWGLRFDYSKRSDYIKVLLGDLGNLPTSEQFHWKMENVQPFDNSYFESSVIAGYVRNSKKFKYAYTTLQDSWRKACGWDLFMPLRDNDNYRFENLNYLSNNTPELMNEFVLSMWILLVDSINVKKLKQNIANFRDDDQKGKRKRGITILEEFLCSQGFADSATHISYLRHVHSLRSGGTAHRKGDKFEKIAKYFNMDSKNNIQVADDIFTTLTEFLDSLREHFCPDDPD